jgi:hypothetical protein
VAGAALGLSGGEGLGLRRGSCLLLLDRLAAAVAGDALLLIGPGAGRIELELELLALLGGLRAGEGDVASPGLGCLGAGQVKVDGCGLGDSGTGGGDDESGSGCGRQHEAGSKTLRDASSVAGAAVAALVARTHGWVTSRAGDTECKTLA